MHAVGQLGVVVAVNGQSWVCIICFGPRTGRSGACGLSLGLALGVSGLLVRAVCVSVCTVYVRDENV